MTTSTPSVAELGHVGLRCHDLSRQLAFYTGVLGLTVTDHDERLGIWFLSARPDTEHHELLLAEGRDAPGGSKLIRQMSFRCARFEDVLGFHRRFREHDVRLDMIVSHGNGVGVHFYDPEGNRCEVHWQTGLVARQPFVEHIDIETDPEELLDAIRASVERHGGTGFTEESYRAWTREQAVAADGAAAGEAELLAAGRTALRRGATVPLVDVVPLSPIATPPTVRDFYAFEQHVRAGRVWRGLEMEPDWYELPVFYFSNPYAVTGCGPAPMTPGAERCDFELEVAAVRHGGNDPLVSLDRQKVFPDLSAHPTLRVWDDGDHTVYNHSAERTELVCDWFRAQLGRA